MTFEKLQLDEEIWDGEMVATHLNGKKLLIVHADGDFYIYEDRCRHKGVPLSEGILEKNVITCGAHHWQYDVITGKGLNPKNTCLRSFPTELRSDGLYVDLGDPDE